MGLFKKNIENSVNEKPKFYNDFFGLNLFSCKGNIWYDPYLWTVLQTIFNGLRNVAYIFDSNDEKLENFLTDNLIYMIWLLWNFGYIVVDVDKKGDYYIPDYSKLRKDGYGRIIGYDCVYYSDKYRFKNRSDFQMIHSVLGELGSYKDALQNLTNNLGAIGILSGQNLPVNPQEKEDFVNNLKSRYGINSDKNNILVTTLPLKFDLMKFPVDELKLDEKVRDCYTLICNYFQVPVDMIFGNSTYANSEQALRNFYTNCISPLAEIVLEVGRYLIKMQANMLIPADNLSFRIDNVPEMITAVRTIDTDYINDISANIKQLKEIGVDTKALEDKLLDYINSMK